MLIPDYAPLDRHCETPITDADRLRAIDWSFSAGGKASKVEAIHPYPAKFIGEIPAAFLSSLPIPANTAVIDPFCGSGTTLLEAQKFGRSSVGIDLNPIACLISRVKTSPLADGFLEAVQQVSEEAQAVKKVVIPDIPNVDHWFKEEIQKAVATLAVTLAKPCYAPWQDALRLALSCILVRVSNQDSDTRYAAVDKGIVAADVFTQFRLAAQKMSKALATRSWALPSGVVA